MPSSQLVEEADRIGKRIIGNAIPTSGGCTWNVITQDRPRGRYAIKRAPAESTVYKGLAGIALFLAELWGVTGSRETLEFATKALRQAELLTAGKRPSVGLYSGSVGVAMVAARLAQLSQDEVWRDLAIRQLQGLESVTQNAGQDMVAGAAGAILGLYQIDAMVGLPHLRESALQLGRQLESKACRTTDGWSWRSRGIGWQNLTGYAHGASGMAHAFLEVYATTGDPRWRFAASRAMSYERRCEVGESGDWFEYRCSEIIRARTDDDDDWLTLRKQLREGSIIPPPPAPRILTQWCYGSPGIALARIRAVSLHVDEKVAREELERALRRTRESLTKTGSHCLCHGFFGNLEAISIARERLGVDGGGIIDSMTQRTLEGIGRGGWRHGAVDVGVGYEPSLLVGEAGIGHALLRLSNPNVPSVLCVSTWSNAPSLRSDAEFRRTEAELFLPRVFRALRVHPERDLQSRVEASVVSESEMTTAVAAISGMVAHDTSPGGEMMRDALAVDSAVLEEQSAFNDFIHQFCYELARTTLDEANLDSAKLRIAPHVRIVVSRWAWSSWSDGNPIPDARPETVLIFRSDDRVVALPLTELQNAILTGLTDARTLAEIQTAVTDIVDCNSSDSHDLPGYVRAIVRQAVRAGMVDIVA